MNDVGFDVREPKHLTEFCSRRRGEVKKKRGYVQQSEN